MKNSIYSPYQFGDIVDEIKIINEIDDIVDILSTYLGVSVIVARTLTYLRNVDKATSIELQKGTGLSQPEISLAMNELKSKGLDWVDESDEKKPGKGRPIKIYSLKVEFDDIITQLENKRKKELDDAMAAIARLKKMAREKAHKIRLALIQEMIKQDQIESIKCDPENY